MGQPVPPVLWPNEGSGFEADPSSSAGQLQGEAMLLQGLFADSGHAGRAAPWVAVGIDAIMAFPIGVTLLLRCH